MADRTFIRQDKQVRSSELYDDNVPPSEVAYETDPEFLQENLNHLRSQVSNLIDGRLGDWFTDLIVPSLLDPGLRRGVNDLNSALHAMEKLRFLRNIHNLSNVTVGASDNFVILGSGELPVNTTASLGAVTSLGTVMATHGGTFGTHSMSSVPGENALNPHSLMIIVDGATNDLILSDGRVIYGLLQAESGISDGSTVSDISPNRIQVSFVRIDASGSSLSVVPSSDIQGKVISYATRERSRLQDMNEQDFLQGAVVDVSESMSAATHRALDQLPHEIAENSFDEFVYTGSRVDAINVWTDLTKVTKIRDQNFTYTGNKVTTIVTVQYDAAGAVKAGETMTEVFAYSGSKILSITRTLT